MKIAILSNVNMNSVIRLLGKETEIYQTEGYGNELGVMMNPDSSYHQFDPEYTFLIPDLMELLGHDLDPVRAKERIEGWFSGLKGALKQGRLYYIADAYLWGAELNVVHDTGVKPALEGMWRNCLKEFCREHSNVRILPYRKLLEDIGEDNAFSMKMWYMGKILLGNEAQRRLGALILDKLRVETRTPKKLLLLDLDNTLWGGLAGENDHTPVVLSEEHIGLAYKNLQRVILQMQRQGVLLAIVSKNNEEDVEEILKYHPHMVLRPECFAAKRINWKPKHENIKEIAKELNLGVDSFVFWDDNPAERQLIMELLPQVTVPDFPDRPEDYAPAMAQVYREYFAKPAVTEEDLEKTNQYAANVSRKQFEEEIGNFEDYLKNLGTKAERVEPERHTERLTQLVNKTNQFNLTTKRYTQAQIEELVRDTGKEVYLYSISDRFGDSGIVAAGIVDLSGEIPVLEEFVMSCRVMGRRVEHALVEDMERDLRQRGFQRLRGIYLPTSKNGAVEKLYSQLGYEKTSDLPDGGAEYEIQLANTPKRMYYVEMKNQYRWGRYDGEV